MRHAAVSGHWSDNIKTFHSTRLHIDTVNTESTVENIHILSLGPYERLRVATVVHLKRFLLVSVLH